MKFPLLSASIPVLLFASLPTATICLQAETHCPGDVAPVTARLVDRALMVIAVKINNLGPFYFMVDTGSQLTVIDPSVARKLDLKPEGSVVMVATAGTSQASVAVLDKLEVGPHVMKGLQVAVLDLQQIQAADARIRGVLGLNFLSHFNVLIDYPHKLLCLDDGKRMQGEIPGEHIPLLQAKHPENDLVFTNRLVISVHLSDTGERQIRLQLDSGSDGPILYAGNKELEMALLRFATLQGENAGKVQRSFAVLPPQDMRLGTRRLNRIPFVTPVRAAQDMPDREEDGVLPTLLFQRVYISNSDHYVVFDVK